MPHAPYRLSTWVLIAWLSSLAVVVAPAWAAEIQLKNGLTLRGATVRVSSIGDSPLAPGGSDEAGLRSIQLVDDGLRRFFVPVFQVEAVTDIAELRHEKIKLQQRVATGGRMVGSIGSILHIGPFDNWGRRTFSLLGPRGRLDIIQGITEITPLWTRVEGLMLSSQSYNWDMRIATSSIPRKTLSKILLTHLDRNDPDTRLSLVRLYLQSERYRDAQIELAEAIKQFPELAELQTQVKELQQLSARQLLGEIKRFKSAGRHRLVLDMLNNFPTKGIAGEILLEVRELLNEYQEAEKRAAATLQTLDQQLATLPDGGQRETARQITEEIRSQLTFDTFDRLADFVRLADDQQMPADQKVALAISGWLLGPGHANQNLAVAVSLLQARQLVRTYLVSSDPIERKKILDTLHSLESGTPTYLAHLLATMTPPAETLGIPENQAKSLIKSAAPETASPEDASPEPPPDGASSIAEDPEKGHNDHPPGYLRVTAPGVSNGATITYHVQLPPEYDPNRRYPTIVTLHGRGVTAPMQIDWWAGAYDPKLPFRAGQATRLGYIVIAPEWCGANQKRYEYSLQEHTAVIHSLRDACQRFSIDVDRVFLSGHGTGGDAAWDMGLAHPDHWAGVIPIVASAEYGKPNSPKYISQYWENARLVPLYFVSGQKDHAKLARNSRDWNRYLTRPKMDVIVSEYQGRGEEHFHDEIHQLFDWMSHHHRNFVQREFEVATMRLWDNYFWWLELSKLPANSMVLPAAWPSRGVPRAITVEAAIRTNNSIRVKTGADNVTIWLNPDLLAMGRPLVLSVNGRRRRVEAKPSIDVLLEDARTRADRQHPFWAKIEMP